MAPLLGVSCSNCFALCSRGSMSLEAMRVTGGSGRSTRGGQHLLAPLLPHASRWVLSQFCDSLRTRGVAALCVAAVCSSACFNYSDMSSKQLSHVNSVPIFLKNSSSSHYLPFLLYRPTQLYGTCELSNDIGGVAHLLSVDQLAISSQ